MPATTVRLPLIEAPENRAGDTLTDAKIINGFIEPVSQQETWVFKRPGTQRLYTVPAGNGRGIYNWGGDIYFIVGGKLYKNGATLGPVDDDGSRYFFIGLLGATQKLFFKSSSRAYTYDPVGGIVRVDTQPNFPSLTAGGMAYLDGTLYVGDQNTSIYGSGINDPMTWNPLNVIQAQIESDRLIFITKQLAYVIAMKQWSTEVFYDAGNASGSPLGPVQGGKINFGCHRAASVVEIDGALFWLGKTRSGSFSVLALDNLKPQIISTPAVERLIESSDVSQVTAWGWKVMGHTFYGLTLVNSDLTLVYDIRTQRWYQWEDATGGHMPYYGSTFTDDGHALVLQESEGEVYRVDGEIYLDDETPFTMTIVTPNFDGDTRKRKFLSNIDFITDQVPGSLLTMSYSEDDYTTWSTPKTVDLGTLRPRLTALGTFRRRAFKFTHSGAYPLRLKAIEMTLELGTL